MSTDRCTNERALALAHKLKEMVEKYYGEPSQSERHAEMNAIQAEIECLGFTVVREVGVTIAPVTGKAFVTADITLYRCASTPTSH
jgi:hypothetical protein